MAALTLGKQERLKSRKLIDRLFKEGKSFSVFPFRVYYCFTPAMEVPLQAGFTVSSRHFKKAVDRNRIKRVIREAYRLQKTALQQYLEENNLHLAVFFIYIAKELPAGDLPARKTGDALQRLIQQVHEKVAPNT